MKYKVIRTCYWNRRLWEEGDVVELEGEVPEHFRPLYSPKEKLEMQMGELPQQPNLEDLNVGQLQKLARENGLEVPKTAKKEELISALRGE